MLSLVTIVYEINNNRDHSYIFVSQQKQNLSKPLNL